MVTIRIDRRTGQTLSVDFEPSPDDQPIEKLADIVADYAIEAGFFNQKGACV